MAMSCQVCYHHAFSLCGGVRASGCQYNRRYQCSYGHERVLLGIDVQKHGFMTGHDARRILSVLFTEPYSKDADYTLSPDLLQVIFHESENSLDLGIVNNSFENMLWRMLWLPSDLLGILWSVG
jgi:hypothetical protein